MPIVPESQKPLSETIFAGGGEMGALMRSYKWSSTPLGSIETWSQSLRTAIGICLFSPVPQSVIWGREFVLLYNEGYRAILGDSHPHVLGRSIEENESEFWLTLRPILNDLTQTGQPAYFADNFHRIDSNREAHHSFSPIFDETGQVAGISHFAIRTTYNPETTAIAASPYLEEALRELPEPNSEVEPRNSKSGAQSFDVQPPTIEIQSQTSNIQPSFSNNQAQSSDLQALSSNNQGQSSDLRAPSSNNQGQSLRIQSLYLTLQAQNLNIQGLYSKAQALKSDIQALNSNIQSSISNYKTVRVLLVDSNADMREYVKRLLSERWNVETAANGAIALEKIQNDPPDLVLSDVMMPEMDGFQLLYALRSNPNTKSIPIILLSARAGEEAAIGGLEAGADDYLIKPFSARELITRVTTQLQMSGLRQEQSANRLKDEFLLTVTHELLSPLATILGWARFLQTKSFDPNTMTRALAAIERNATIEARLVKNLLDVSSILARKLCLKPQLVDLAPLVQNVTATFREAAETKQIQLIETISNAVPSNIFADGDRFKQIIANLLENAIKFTPQGGQVTIQLERFGAGVQITVRDTGAGIRPDFLPYVFDRFTQAEVPSRSTPGGVGLGLTIACHLVELHHGTIEVASEGEGRGTTFTVRLPLTNAAQIKSDPQVQE